MDLGSLSIKPKDFLFKSVFLLGFPPALCKFGEATTDCCWHQSLARKRATYVKQINYYQHLSVTYPKGPVCRTSSNTHPVLFHRSWSHNFFEHTTKIRSVFHHHLMLNSFSMWCAFPVFCPINILSWSTERAFEQPKPDKKPVRSSQRRWIILQQKELLNHDMIIFKYPSCYYKSTLIGQQRSSSTERERRDLHVVGHKRKNHMAIKAAATVELQNKGKKNPPPLWLFPSCHTIILFSN